MSDPLTYTEIINRPIEEMGIQITTGLKSALLTNTGKPASALLEEFTEDEQAKIKEVFGFVSEKLLKKADGTYTGKAADIITAVEEKEEKAEAPVEPEPVPEQ